MSTKARLNNIRYTQVQSITKDEHYSNFSNFRLWNSFGLQCPYQLEKSHPQSQPHHPGALGHGFHLDLHPKISS